jgi:MFS family permease
MAIGPSIGLGLTNLIGYQNTFFSTFAAMALIGVLVFLFVKPVNDTGGGRIKFNLSINNIIAKEALLPTGLIFISSMVFFVISTFLILFAKERNIERIGLFFTVYSITLLFSRPFTGRLTDKIGAVKVLIPAIVCFASSFVLISFSTALWMFLLAAFIQGFGYGAVLPQLQALVIKSVTKERRSVASCTSYIGNDLGTFAGPILGGFVATRAGYAQMWLIMVIPILLALGIVIIFRYKIDKIGGTVPTDGE